MKGKLYSIISLILLTAFVLISMSGCRTTDMNENGKTVTDMRGRTVSVPEDPQRIVCIGASALRLYCYIGDMSLLCGVEDFEKDDRMPVRPYSFAYGDLFLELPSAGAGGPMSSADAEAIALLEPELIFSMYDSIEEADSLQTKTGVPVVCLSYGGADPFGERFSGSMKLMGAILGEEKRASEISDYIEDTLSELKRRTETIENKPLAYLACNTYNGGKGSFSDTMADFCCFEAVEAENVIGNGYPTNNPTVDIETVAGADPEYIFADAANIGTLEAEYIKNKALFGNMRAFRDKKVFCFMPFNQYYTNMEIALADCWYVGTVLYGEAFSDVLPYEKLDEICSFFLRKDSEYGKMAKQFCPYGFENYFSK